MHLQESESSPGISGYKTESWWWSWEPLWQLHAPSTLQQLIHWGGKRERQIARGWKLPACFCQDTSVSGHASAAHVSWSEHKLSAWRTQKFLWQIPRLHSKSHYNRKLVPLQWAAPSLSWDAPAAEAPWLESHVLKPGRAASLIVICIYRAELLYS